MISATRNMIVIWFVSLVIFLICAIKFNDQQSLWWFGGGSFVFNILLSWNLMCLVKENDRLANELKEELLKRLKQKGLFDE